MIAGALSRVEFARALRDACITGFIALVLFLPLIGFQTAQNGRNELVLLTRWPLLGAIVAIVVAARLFYALVMMPWLARRAMRPVAAAARSLWRARFGKWFVPFAIGFVIVY